MQMNSKFANMNEAQKNLAKNCKSKEELSNLMESDMMKLSEDQLDTVGGGEGSASPKCPHPEEGGMCGECDYRMVNGIKCPACELGDSREGVSPEMVSKVLAEGKLTGAAFFA